MRITQRLCLVLLVAIPCGLWCTDGFAQDAFERVEGMDIEVARDLRDAGYDLDEPSLVRALLQHSRGGTSDFLIPVYAAWFLARLPPSETIRQALLAAAVDPVDAIAINAMRSLHRLGDARWHDLARQRLAGTSDRLWQVSLATLLAEAGRADGWPLVVRALRGEDRSTMSSLALRDVATFDGLVNLDGRAIDVVAELEALRIQVPEAAAQFTDAIERTRQRREPPRRPSGPVARAAPFLQGLVDAGFQPDDPFSLMLAMTQASDLQVRLTAASALAGFPGNPAVVGGLQAAVQGGDDLVAVRAAESLQTLAATGWEGAAVARLTVMEAEHRLGRITLARVLAQAGRADGWPVITGALTDNQWFLEALVEVPHFDGLTDREGRVIDAAAVLLALRTRDPRGEQGPVNRLIGQALLQVEAKRSGAR